MFLRRLRPSVPLLTSATTWAALPIAALILYGYLVVENPFPSDPYWNSYLARASTGLNYGLPLASGLAAWSADRYRRSRIATELRPTRSAIRVYWSLTWSVYVTVAIGYAAALLWQLVESPPAASIPDPRLLLCFLAMTATAVSLGFVAGSLVHAAVAVPVAVLAMFVWITYPQFNVASISARNITGYTVYDCCGSYYSIPDPRSLLAPVVVSIPVVLAAILVTKRLRRVTLPTSALGAVAAVGVAVVIVTGTAAFPQSARASTGLVCEGSQPKICLFPDQGSGPRGDALRSALKLSYQTARARGVALPELIVSSSSSARTLTRTNLRMSTDTPSRDSVARDYALSVYEQSACASAQQASGSADQRIPYALAVSMGGDVKGELPQLSTSVDASAASVDVPPSQVQRILRINSEAQAVAVAKSWTHSVQHCEENR